MFDAIPDVLVPLVIFCARILDVSLATIRIMLISRGVRGKATLIGFFEVLIWIIVVVQVIQNLDNWLNYIAFAAGFSTGNYVGMRIEEKMKVGTQIFRIITNQDSGKLVEMLKKEDFRITTIDAEGARGPVKIIFSVTPRKRWKELTHLIDRYAPEAFYSVEDVRYSFENNVPDGRAPLMSRLLRLTKRR